MKQIIISFALVILTSGSIASEALPAADQGKTTIGQKNPDPAVGRWRPVNSGIPLTLNADGTAVDTRNGKWVCLNPAVTPRKYQITWSEGQWIDTLSLVKGGKELVGENQDHLKLRWLRIPQ